MRRAVRVGGTDAARFRRRTCAAECPTGGMEWEADARKPPCDGTSPNWSGSSVSGALPGDGLYRRPPAFRTRRWCTAKICAIDCLDVATLITLA
jgi:hypothetical protein